MAILQAKGTVVNTDRMAARVPVFATSLLSVMDDVRVVSSMQCTWQVQHKIMVRVCVSELVCAPLRVVASAVFPNGVD